MVFGPTWQPVADPSSLDAIAVAREAATSLLSAIETARHHSDDWTNSELASALVEQAMSKCLAQLATTGLWGRDNQLPSDTFWKIAGEMLSVGRLQHRARTKPLGYAGDHQMLSWIFEGVECEHPLGRHFDRFFLDQAAPQAVCSRTHQVAAAVADHYLKTRGRKNQAPYHLVSVGAGPALDVEQALTMLPQGCRANVRVTLLDLDDEGLTSARNRLTPLLGTDRLVCVRENLFRLARKPAAQQHLAEADFLICTGLFDYLEDDVATGMLTIFWQQLASGAQMVIGNFAPHCPTRAYMEWIGNWYLIYRTREDLAQLAASAGLPQNSWSIGADRTGIDLFLSASKG